MTWCHVLGAWLGFMFGLFVLKVLGLFNISWWFITAPLWLPILVAGIPVVCYLVLLVFLAIVVQIDQHLR